MGEKLHLPKRVHLRFCGKPAHEKPGGGPGARKKDLFRFAHAVSMPRRPAVSGGTCAWLLWAVSSYGAELFLRRITVLAGEGIFVPVLS